MFTLKTFTQLTSSMITWVRAHTNNITDFSIGSTARTILEAVASVIEELYQQVYKSLKTTIEEILYLVFDFPALPARAATGSITLSKTTAATQDYMIPVGTIVATEATAYSDEIRYITTETVILPTGATSITVNAAAEKTGAAGNVKAGAVTRLLTKPIGIDFVTNDTAFIGGQDAETSAQRKARFRDYIASRARGTGSALEYCAKQVTGVVDARSVDSPHLNALIWDGASFTDVTESANDPYAAAVNLLPAVEAVNNAVYIGASLKFPFLYINFITKGVGTGGVWEYYNGTAWVAISGVADGTNGLTASGIIRFTPPADWHDSKISDAWAFWVRFRVTAANYTTTPTIGHIFASPPPGIVELYVQSTAVEASIDTLNAVAADMPDYRGSGISVNILSCTRRALAFVCSIQVDTVNFDKTTIQTEVKSTIVNYLNTFTMGSNFMQSQLITKVMSIKNGAAVLACSLNISDILVSAGEIIRPDEANITVMVVN